MARTVTITLTEEQRDALGYILDLAHGDQESYLSIGNPDKDYGDEWPSAAAFKAQEFRHIAESVGKLFHGETERWNSLADCFEASGKEFRNAEVGN